jgi:hypothetical protein
MSLKLTKIEELELLNFKLTKVKELEQLNLNNMHTKIHESSCNYTKIKVDSFRKFKKILSICLSKQR